MNSKGCEDSVHEFGFGPPDFADFFKNMFLFVLFAPIFRKATQPPSAFFCESWHQVPGQSMDIVDGEVGGPKDSGRSRASVDGQAVNEPRSRVFDGFCGDMFQNSAKCL